MQPPFVGEGESLAKSCLEFKSLLFFPERESCHWSVLCTLVIRTAVVTKISVLHMGSKPKQFLVSNCLRFIFIYLFIYLFRLFSTMCQYHPDRTLSKKRTHLSFSLRFLSTNIRDFPFFSLQQDKVLKAIQIQILHIP